MPIKAHSVIILASVGELVPAALEQLENGGSLALAGTYGRKADLGSPPWLLGNQIHPKAF